MDVDLSVTDRVDEARATRDVSYDVRQCRGGADGDDESKEVQRNLRLLRQQESLLLPTRWTTRARTE
jgi:hypothetical protein